MISFTNTIQVGDIIKDTDRYKEIGTVTLNSGENGIPFQYFNICIENKNLVSSALAIKYNEKRYEFDFEYSNDSLQCVKWELLYGIRNMKLYKTEDIILSYRTKKFLRREKYETNLTITPIELEKNTGENKNELPLEMKSNKFVVEGTGGSNLNDAVTINPIFNYKKNETKRLKVYPNKRTILGGFSVITNKNNISLDEITLNFGGHGMKAIYIGGVFEKVYLHTSNKDLYGGGSKDNYYNGKEIITTPNNDLSLLSEKEIGRFSREVTFSLGDSFSLQ